MNDLGLIIYLLFAIVIIFYNLISLFRPRGVQPLLFMVSGIPLLVATEFLDHWNLFGLVLVSQIALGVLIFLVLFSAHKVSSKISA